MGGGVVLGSLYLGMDIQKIAIGVLEQSQIVAPGYFERTAGAPAAQGASPTSDSAAHDSAGASVAAVAAKTDTAALPGQPSAESVPAKESSFAERSAATRSYWDQLTASMQAEARSRTDGARNPAEWELYDYLSQRLSGHKAVLEQLERLSTTGVDSRLLEHGEQVTNWHKSAIKLFKHALSLLSDGPGAKLTGPFAQSWQSAATQLRMEENLVIERHKGIANFLDREYASEAPFVPAYQQP